MKILIIEDNEDTALVLQEFFADVGFKADVAVTGREALQKFRKGRHQMLITDFMLPDTDGYSLVKKCKGIANDVKVIYLTGVDIGKNLSQVEVGADCQIIKKPARPGDILKMVHKMTE